MEDKQINVGRGGKKKKHPNRGYRIRAYHRCHHYRSLVGNWGNGTSGMVSFFFFLFPSRCAVVHCVSALLSVCHSLSHGRILVLTGAFPALFLIFFLFGFWVFVIDH